MLEIFYKVLNSIKENTKENTVLVFKGFPYSKLRKLDYKFFKSWDKLIVNNENMRELEEQVFKYTMLAIEKENNVFWMTYEEFIICYDIIKFNFDIKIVENNLYNKKFPYDNTIKDIERVYRSYFYNVEEEIDDKYKEEYENITRFYGDISYSNNSKNYYITYSDSIAKDLEHINLYRLTGDKYNVGIIDDEIEAVEAFTLELSEDEIAFLDMTNYLLNSKRPPKKVCIVTAIKLDDLPNRYRDRVEILQKILGNKVKLFFSMKTIESSYIDNLQEYLHLLKTYWGYDSFRDLSMYKDVRSKKKTKIKISQAQIIDDIVKQTSLALDNENYRDIFITSPTGSGKSIMFQLPSLYLAKKYEDINPLTIVISPLIALMNDQVNSLKNKGIDVARTINSNTLPFEREKILKEVQNGKCSILYLSPETLQARYNIKELIGERYLGLVIIDEAHIVTTWGKTFRADYWYLGIFLQKLRKFYRFPIVTFTATAIYGGKEDMYLETRDSLNMINPISYFGTVKRKDIFMMISSLEKLNEHFIKNSRDYRKTKYQLTLNHLEESYKRKEKTLVYFPTIETLKQFTTFLMQNNSEIYSVTGQYYGSLEKEKKDEVLNLFKSGEILYVLATKAFGMGVDIPDIKYVYHYAPTGGVIDYIQEIGRVARDKELLDVGFARCDFLPRDFNYINRLRAMSSIRNNQLLQIMEKIVDIYKERDSSRNLLIRAEDFKYIFMNNNEDENGLENKIKTALLLIEKDFSLPSNIGYPPFIARPKSVFGNEMILMNNKLLNEIEKFGLGKYIRYKYNLERSNFNSVYSVNISQLWEDHYKVYTFPDFKRRLFTPDECRKLKHGKLLMKFCYCTGISTLNMNNSEINDVISIFNKYITVFSNFSAEKKRLEKYFTAEELGSYLRRNLKINDEFKARSIAQALINSCFEYQKLKNYKFIRGRSRLDGLTYTYQNSYDDFIGFLKAGFENYLKSKKQYYQDDELFIKFYFRNDNSQFNYDIIILGIAQTIGLINYTVENGNSPQIYIRINSILPLEQAIKKGKYYSNSLLNDIYLRHRVSVEMLRYLFTYKVDGNNPKEIILNYTDFFWNSIENYFLGEIPSRVEENLYKKRN